MTRLSKSTLAMVVAVACVVPSVALAQPARGETDSRPIRDQAKQPAQAQVPSVDALKTQIANKSADTNLRVRQEVCEQNRTRLMTSTQSMYQGAESVKKSLDTMYQRVVDFYDKSQLTTPNYEELIKQVETSKLTAENTMTALETRENADVDCADAKTASRLEGDRLAGQGTRDTLKQYQKDLVALISAMRSASATTTEEM